MWLNGVIYTDNMNPNNCTCQKGKGYLRIISGRPSMTLIEVLIEKFPAKTLQRQKAQILGQEGLSNYFLI